MDIVIGSILGVLFHEAIRIYRCFLSKRTIIPKNGFGKRINAIIYIVVLCVFVLVSFYLTTFLGITNPVAAFVFGVSVPNGLSNLKPISKPEQVDDFWSEQSNVKFSHHMSSWITEYYE